MLPDTLILVCALAYIGLLFAIAHWADRAAEAGRSVIANPTIYALSLAVYCTTWTYYGSVGRATSGGLSFLTIYLGPTLMLFFVGVIVKMIRISKAQRITSIADFIASRYGKSHLLAGLVTVIAVLGILLGIFVVVGSQRILAPLPRLHARVQAVARGDLIPRDEVTRCEGSRVWTAMHGPDELDCVIYATGMRENGMISRASTLEPMAAPRTDGSGPSIRMP